uniref:NADH-ubiquinone oxidoreductase chain 1 n=1 Tax=Tanystylum orbiculare TaxID=88027 RepID=E0XLF2_TANOR|nr:NADH dehydrogenase subunit 1 [Tanystylum orbiculare]ADB91997.1 NADH dehydrogenase subunit 1 [Tanystylum orbiculare]
MIDSIISYLMILIMVLISVGFFTLLERKILSYINNRKGPNKVGLIGLAQPISDGIKLILKEYYFPYLSVNFLFLLSPMFIFILSMLMWVLIPIKSKMLDFNYGFYFFLCLTGLSVYALIFCGWSSNSKYAIYGAYRGVAQTISYEVSLALLMLSIVFINDSYNFMNMSINQSYCWLMIFMMPMCMIWLVSMLAGTNRTPFDFSEGESELVSGFNIEYGSYFFALIFIGEYSSIIFMSVIFVMLFMGGWSKIYMIKVMLLIFIFILIRGTLPRFRYDNLMYLAWKIFLPMTINFLMFFYLFKVLIILL